MKLFSKKIAGVAAVAAVALPAATYAASTNVDATATFLTAITLSPVTMAFGNIEFSAAGAGDTASMGTNGAIVYGGNFSGSGTGTAGAVDITAGSEGSTVEVRCDASATLTDGAGASIDLVSIEVVAEGSEGAFGTGSACVNTSTVSTTMVLDIVTTGAADRFSLGGQLDGSTVAAFTSGSYSTANAGGDDIQVDIFYQ